MKSVRLPRFHRAPAIGSFKLTHRDRELIRYVFEHRFLRSTHLTRLLDGSRQQILRRLQLCFHHGYLDRPRAQIDYYRSGSQAMVYGLGSKGMQLLEREDGIPQRKLSWIARNRSLTRYFMEHTLAVADIMVALELSCRRRPFEIVDYCGIGDQGFKWSVTVSHNGLAAKIGIIPDRVIGLNEEHGTRWLFLEADRATMPVERNNLKQTSFYRKLIAYHETWRQGILRPSFSRFQVLTVTTTRERVENLLRVTRRLTPNNGIGLFLFADHKTFVSANDLLSLPIINGRGEKVALVN